MKDKTNSMNRQAVGSGSEQGYERIPRSEIKTYHDRKMRQLEWANLADNCQLMRVEGMEDYDEDFLGSGFLLRGGGLGGRTRFLRLGGAGDLDIGEGRMNYLAKAAVVNTSAGQGGKDLEGLAGLTVPVRISGPFESLSYRLEIGSLVSDTVKQKVQEQVKGQVQDRLKGLFGR